MRHCIIAVFFLSFVFTGCMSSFMQSSASNSAKNHMQKAYEHEQASEFEAAAKEYAIVIQKYPDTNYYEDALYNGAMANINSQNPNPDYSTALALMKKYSTFSLFYQRRQAVNGYLELLTVIEKNLEREQQNQNSMVQQKKEATKQKQAINWLKKELEKYKTKTTELEDKLQKMKDIDVQMHENRRKQRPNS